MANEHTIVPGMSESNDSTTMGYQGRKSYSRQSGYADADSSGTRIPGMDSQPNQGGPQEQMIGKPVVGFLVSVSRTEEGEYWVLKQGQNTIGSNSNCNIVLNELSVSSMHAVLAIHRNPGDKNRLSVGIMDKGSSTGVFVNDNYIAFNPCQCKDRDKIRIGNYELLLILFDAVDYNMRKNEKFALKGDFDYSDRDVYSVNDDTRF